MLFTSISCSFYRMENEEVRVHLAHFHYLKLLLSFETIDRFFVRCGSVSVWVVRWIFIDPDSLMNSHVAKEPRTSNLEHRISNISIATTIIDESIVRPKSKTTIRKYYISLYLMFYYPYSTFVFAPLKKLWAKVKVKAEAKTEWIWTDTDDVVTIVIYRLFNYTCCNL